VSFTYAGGGSSSASESTSDEPIGSNRLYAVLEGERPLVTIPHDIWECCPVEGIKKTECYTFIVEGLMCEGPKDPCQDSASDG
jgi:hypothetical protein